MDKSKLAILSKSSSLPSATATFNQAWTIYKQRLGTFLGIMAIPMLIVALLTIFLGVGSINIISISSKFAAGKIGLAIFLFIIYFVSFSVIQTLERIALLYAIKDSKDKIGVIESYRRGFRKIFSYWWISLLSAFIFLGGFSLLIAPGIIFAVWFSLAEYILIAEDSKGMSALIKSREYVKGYSGGVLWRFIFITGFSLIISLVVSFVFSFLKIPSQIIGFATTMFLTPLTTVYSFLIYSNLKALKGKISPESSKSRNIIFIIVGILGLVILIAFVFLVIFSLGTALKSKVRQGSIGTQFGANVQSKIQSGKKCKTYGFSPKNKFLTEYIVKRGDTLQSIANIQLGNVSRAYELVLINDDMYSGISEVNSSLNEGWRLFLPPKDVLNSTGTLKQMNGEIVAIIGKDHYPGWTQWTIDSGEKNTNYIQFIKDTKFRDDDMSEYKSGDCISAIINEHNKAYAVNSQ